MIIKTITCHDVYNTGASLQAYALAEYLKSLGHDVEIINYKPEYLHDYRLTGVSNPKYDRPVLRKIYQLLKFPGRLKTHFSKRKKEFDRFREEYLPVTSKRYTSCEELAAAPPQADVYIAGSDQIWNTKFKNGKDPAFYLDFAPKGSIKASYASSFATDRIEPGCKKQVGEWLSKLDHISVRESSGLKIIEDLGISGAVQVLDPVFLLDAEHWEKLERPMEFNEPYILLYDFDNNSVICDYVKRMAEENDWKIYSVLPCDYSDKCFDQEGPLSFLSLVHNARYVVSNSFHATAFSLIFERPFAVFDRIEEINTRMRDLVKMLELKSVNETFDFTAIRDRLNKCTEESKQYIAWILEAAKEKN